MAISRVERSEWGVFCFRVSHIFLGKQADIEVASLEIGVQPEARRLPLEGMFYDPGEDVLRLVVGHMNYLIRAPRELYADEDPLGIVALQIVDADGVRQIVTLRDPVLLPDRASF
jgi:hypothetical protein